jgi:general secretion pathway protein M
MALVLNSRQNRTLALTLLALAIVLGVAVLVLPPYLLHRHYDFYLDSYSDQLARYQRLANTREATQAKLAAIKAREPRKYFLKNAGPALGASEIQDVAKSLIEGNGGKLIATQVLPPKDDGRFRQIVINVQLSASSPALRNIVYAAENAQPYLFIDNLLVRSNQSYNYRPNPGVEPEMFIQFDLSAFAVTAP